MAPDKKIISSPVSAVLFPLALLLVLASCSSSKKMGPPASTLSLNLPDTLPALPASEIDLPIKIYAPPVLAMADSIVPREFNSPGWPAYLTASCEFRYKYHFVRSAFVLSCSNNKIGLQMRGNYQVAGSRCFCALGRPVSPWVSGNCGFGNEALRRVDISIRSDLAFLPGYRIRTTTRVDQLKALDKCVVSILSSDITQEIVDSIQASIASFCSALDQRMAGLDVAGYMRQLTVKANQKTAIGSYGYLAINPTAIRVGQLNYAKDTFSFAMGISCRPICTSDSSNPALIAALPPLSTGNNREGVSLYLPANYDYAFISGLLHDIGHDRTFLYKGSTIVIKDVAIKGIGNHQVEIKIDFDGTRKGRVFLRGTPILDIAKQSLSIPDISYSLESKDLVLKMARTLLRNKIRKSLQGSSYLDLAALLKANLPLLDAQLNRQLSPNLYTRGNAKDVRMIGLLAGDKTLQVQLALKADLSVISSGLPR
jgi:Domain of unknown function (DUF4403)